MCGRASACEKVSAALLGGGRGGGGDQLDMRVESCEGGRSETIENRKKLLCSKVCLGSDECNHFFDENSSSKSKC